MLIIRNGHIVDVESEPVTSRLGDVLIEDDRIIEVGPGLDPPPGTEMIDATGRIVLPGFVDTHRHTWLAPLRALLPDTLLEHYLQRVIFGIAPRIRPDEVHAALLAGTLECVDAGITTVLDWSDTVHLSPAHRDAAIDATAQSGLRAVVCLKAGDVRGTDIGTTLLTPAVSSLGLAFAGEDAVLRDWAVAHELDCLLTVHNGSTSKDSGGMDDLRRLGLLRPKTLYAHASGLSDDGYRLIADSGGAIAVTPAIETAMDHGTPATGSAREFGIRAGLGADVVTSGPGDMFSLMRLAYALQRAGDKTFTTGDVLRMATLDGAAALGLGEVTGSLRAGKQADAVLLRTDTLGMSGAYDRAAAVVHSADTSTVDTVLVGGTVVKRDGRLTGHAVGDVVAAVRTAAERLASL